MAQERMHAAQVGSALVEKERGGRMSQRVGGITAPALWSAPPLIGIMK
jgi:hypothetical protein